MTFSAVVQADVLEDTLAPVRALVAECKIHCEPDGLEIRAVDPANVGMVDLDLDAGAFASYSADGGLIGVDLDRLADVVGMADAGDMVHLDLDEETRTLDISIGGLDYTLALINPDSIRQEPDLPDLDLPATYVLEAQEVSRAVSAADLVSDHIEIVGASSGEVRFVADGDTDDVEVTVGEAGLMSGRHNGDGPVASLFSLDYLNDMAGVIDSDGELSLRVGQEFPVKMRYSAVDGALEVVNMLAPRVQSE